MLDLPPPTPPPPEAKLRAPEVPPAPPPDIAIEPQDVASDIQATDNETAESIATGERQHTGRNAFNATEIAKQVWQVQEWLVAGIRPNQIRRLSQQEWGIGSRTADSRIASARQQMVHDINVLDRQQKVGQMVEQLEKVLAMSLETKQGSNAIGALRLQADLLQLLTRQN